MTCTQNLKALVFLEKKLWVVDVKKYLEIKATKITMFGDMDPKGYCSYGYKILRRCF